MQTTRRTEMKDNHREVLASLEAFREEAMKREAAKLQQEQIDAVLASVPERFRGKTFADYHVEYPAQAEVKHLLETYVETSHDRLVEGAGLIFTGKTGTGKSLLAYILDQCLIKKGTRVEYQPSLQFLRLLHEKQFESHHAFESHLNHYKTLPFLIIDEATEGCGKGACPADWERHLFRVLVDVRYQAKRCTLIITNRDKKELIDRLGEPAIDRLLENGVLLAFNWKSYRQNKDK